MVNLMELTDCIREVATKVTNEMFKTGEIPRTLTLEKKNPNHNLKLQDQKKIQLLVPSVDYLTFNLQTEGFLLLQVSSVLVCQEMYARNVDLNGSLVVGMKHCKKT